MPWMTRAVLFVQLEAALHEGRLLIIRRPWVRVPPAPPAKTLFLLASSWNVSWGKCPLPGCCNGVTRAETGHIE